MKTPMKKLAVGNLGEEELERLQRMTLTRDDTRAEADLLFGAPATDMRKTDRKLLEKLFVQTPASVTMAPNLQKQAQVAQEPMSKTAHVDAFFEALSAPTDAQRRYPELLKVAECNTPKSLSRKARVATDTTGTAPVRSSLSGGSA
jgi:hypothetical protein